MVSNQDIYDKLNAMHTDDRALREAVQKNTSFRLKHVGVYKFIGALSVVSGSVWVAVKGFFHGG